MDVRLEHAFEKYEKLSPFEIKDKLISLAKEHSRKSASAMLNAGRGNPNWVATTPRDAFFLLGQFAMEECRRVSDRPNLGGMPEAPGIAGRLEKFVEAHKDAPGAEMLRDMVPLAVKRFGFVPDAFVHELVDSIVADNYPVPDRMLVHAEQVVHEYLMWAMCDSKPPPGQFDLFAVEGGTAAMCYTFKSLIQNHILHKGDTIALGVPIFTPYLEIPHLNDYEFKVVNVVATQENLFQYSDKELAKLEDPKVKAFFLVNPGNPTSAAIAPEVIEKLVDLVKRKRPDLLILTDDVYGTFVHNFRSLMADLPRNTIGVYSYSKYFGCTGWRLGVVAIHQDNIIDEMIAKHPKAITEELNKRYGSLTLEPSKMKFIDRMVADSRDVALNHTAGLSLPQQVMMTLFSLFQMLDKDETYREATMGIVHRRVAATVEGLGIPATTGTHPLFAAYYGLIDFEFWLKKFGGEDVAKFMRAHYHPLDIVYRLADQHGVVLLNGGGFEAPNWSVRISFANLPDDVYDDIGRIVRSVASTYVEAYRFSANGGAVSKGKDKAKK
ncbi:bifunctional aspartate transaminase/aspartate 4-decarboxylase [Microvirga terricola]|uniref:Aspartate 4-decarboxylase n=1 Tax=Microvirga terricola TaxID=2719797 RepID=A0ABX0VD47_9HYPH|nr:bifunctional aspartate transaminase/aspartate 4-decarboxylase [Microvirga terricola]NIX77768.1 bifunctional aspartate transaminase/aspartate 4-decarboxylase [Microvirga terricola]